MNQPQLNELEVKEEVKLIAIPIGFGEIDMPCNSCLDEDTSEGCKACLGSGVLSRIFEWT